MPRAAATKDRPAAAFGTLLKELRGNRSVETVVRLIRERSQIDTTQGTVSAYEQGYHLSPNPVVLWGLAVAYGVWIEGLIAVLLANSKNPYLTLDDAKDILHRYARGPRPEMAAAALETAERRIHEAAADVGTILEGIREGTPSATKKPRG